MDKFLFFILDFGLEKSVSLADQDAEQVLKSLENLAKSA